MQFFARPLASALAATLALTLFSPHAARADDDAPPGNVARISAIHGEVAIQRGDSQSSVAAVDNAPIMGADYVTTGPSSSAEVQVAPHAFVRLGSDVQMRFVNLDPDQRQLQLAEGTIEYRTFADDHATIDTPSISVVPGDGAGVRVSVTHEGETRVSLRVGTAQVTSPSGSQPLSTDATLIAQGEASNPTITTSDVIAFDDFDTFNRDRDGYYGHAIAQQPNVNPNIDGIADLGQYGRWVPEPTYGNVWVPNVEPEGWAPYREGRWAWEGGYGWTWVSADPWGWAPYHYGSWYHAPGYGWAWVPPGPSVAVVPVYRPALVAFIGFGGGGGVGFNATVGGPGFSLSFGNIGWVPLAPGEPWHPWYGYGNRTVVNNITNVNVTNVYRNVSFNGATGTTYRHFESGTFVNRATYLHSGDNVTVFRGALPIVPSQAHLAFANRPVDTRLATVSGRFVQPGGFAGHAQIAVRAPFETQRQNLAAVTHTQLAPEPEHAMSAVQHTSFAPVAPRTATSFAQPGSRTAPAPRTPAEAWDRFGTARGAARAASPAAQGLAPSYARSSSPRVDSSTPDRSVGSAPAASWSRFGQARDARTSTGYGASRSPDAAQTYGGASRGYAAPRSYSAPRADSAAQRNYSAPRAYNTQRTYSAPQSYGAQRPYSQPAARTSAPRSYAPQRTNASPRPQSDDRRGGQGR